MGSPVAAVEGLVIRLVARGDTTTVESVDELAATAGASRDGPANVVISRSQQGRIIERRLEASLSRGLLLFASGGSWDLHGDLSHLLEVELAKVLAHIIEDISVVGIRLGRLWVREGDVMATKVVTLIARLLVVR